MDKNELIAWRNKNMGIEPSVIGKSFPTALGGGFGGIATITGKGETEGVYVTKSGCLWRLIDNRLVSHYDS